MTTKAWSNRDEGPLGIDAVIFDMDGVLIDSERIWRQVREVFAAEIGRQWTDEDQRAMMGCSTRDWSSRMRERLGIRNMSTVELADEIKRRVHEGFLKSLPVRPGVGQALAALAPRFRLALASGSPRELVDCAMQKTGFGRYFEVQLCGDDVVRGKPQPDIYLKTLARLRVRADRAVGIEDSSNGLRALHAAGIAAIATPCPEFPLTEEDVALARVVLATPGELTPGLVAAQGR